MKPLAYSPLAALCLSCWYLAIKYPLTVLGAFATMWGGALCIDAAMDLRDMARVREAKRMERVKLPTARVVETDWGN